jgi:hypothetical protein
MGAGVYSFVEMAFLVIFLVALGAPKVRNNLEIKVR